MSLAHTTLKLTLPLAISLALVACGGSSSNNSSEDIGFFGTTADTDTTTDDSETVEENETTSEIDNGETVDDTTEDADIQSTVTSLIVYSSSRTLLSDANADSAIEGSEPVTIYMMAKDENNIALSGVTFSPSVDNGATLLPGSLSSDGTLATWLLVPDEPRNQTVNVTVTAGDITETIPIDIVGTSIQIDGAESISMDKPTAYSVKLKDASGTGLSFQPVTITSELLSTTLTTDNEGEALFELQPTIGGEYTIRAEALGSTSNKTINVSPNAFNLNATLEEIPVNTKQTVVLSWSADGVPQSGKIIHLSATRGKITSNGVESDQVITDSNGNANFEIESPTAGGTVVTATDNTTYLSTSLPLEYIATEPHYMNIQADPSLIASLGSSTILAQVRDINDNPVKNQVIVFNLNDTVDGTLSSSKAETDSSGQASVVYTAGKATSATDGVVVTSHIEGATTIKDTTSLTVGGKATRIVFGHDELLSENSPFYTKVLGVIVTDNAGNPVSGKEVNFTIQPINYIKGKLEWNGDSWVLQGDNVTCPSEDLDNDSLLDDGEDFNNSGFLEPTHAATITGNGTTDESGQLVVNITYPQNHALWNTVKISAQVTVDGTEYTEKVLKTLSATAADLQNEDIAPPNHTSPYGTGTECSDPS